MPIVDHHDAEEREPGAGSPPGELADRLQAAIVAGDGAGLERLVAVADRARVADPFQAGRLAGLREVAVRLLAGRPPAPGDISPDDISTVGPASTPRASTGRPGGPGPRRSSEAAAAGGRQVEQLERFTLAGSVLAAAGARPGSTSGELAVACLASLPQISRATRRLAASGLVVGRRLGRQKSWQLTAAGEQMLASWEAER